MKRAVRAGLVLAVSGAAMLGCASVQLATAPAHGCVIPGTSVTVPGESGARFAGAAHSCVNGAWRPFNVTDNLR